MSRTARAWGNLLLALLLSGVGSQAHAQLAVAAPSCEGLDPSTLHARIELEIGEVAAEWQARSTPVVLLGCADDRVRIEITDPVTDKSVARTIAMPAVDRERVLGLAIAQLFLTSWLELLIDDGEAGPGAEAAERRARAALEAAEQPEPEPEPENPEPENPEPENPEPENPEPEPENPEPENPEPPSLRIDGELSLDGSVRVRGDGERLVTAGTALRGLLVIDGALLVGLRGSFEWGRAFRQRGTVHLYAGGLGLLGGWRSPELGPLSLDVSAFVSLTALAFDGHPSRTGVVGGTTLAIVGEGGLELAPSLRAGPFRVSLPLTASGIAFAPEGEVTGEAPVVAGGFVFSASLRIALTTVAN